MIDIWGDEMHSAAAIVLFHGGYWQVENHFIFFFPNNFRPKRTFDIRILFATVYFKYLHFLKLYRQD